MFQTRMKRCLDDLEEINKEDYSLSFKATITDLKKRLMPRTVNAFIIVKDGKRHHFAASTYEEIASTLHLPLAIVSKLFEEFKTMNDSDCFWANKFFKMDSYEIVVCSVSFNN